MILAEMWDLNVSLDDLQPSHSHLIKAVGGDKSLSEEYSPHSHDANEDRTSH